MMENLMSEKLKLATQILDVLFNDPREPRSVGVVLLTFNTDAPAGGLGTGQYAANVAQEDAMRIMRDYLKHAEASPLGEPGEHAAGHA